MITRNNRSKSVRGRVRAKVCVEVRVRVMSRVRVRLVITDAKALCQGVLCS